VAGTDYPRAALEALAERGIDLAGVRQLGRPGGRAWLLYEAGVRRVIVHLDCPSHAEVSPTLADVPEHYWGARALHLAPMPLARQQELAEGIFKRCGGNSLHARPLVSLDPYELLRDDNLELWPAVLKHVDAFFPSEDEVRVRGDVVSVLRKIAGRRLRLVALKRGEHGGELLDLHFETVTKWTSRAREIVDATGAGDAFVGGFLAGWLEHGDAIRAIEQGIVAASFAIEDWGARALMATTPEQAKARWQQWFGSAVTADQ
jgi:ribokinase